MSFILGRYGTPVATGVVTPDEPTITLSVLPSSVLEDGIGNLIYTFSRTGSTVDSLTVNYIVGGSATIDVDYTGINPVGSVKTVTFNPGSSTATIEVDPTSDVTIEPDETVTVGIVSGVGYTIGTLVAVTGTITNDDVAPPPPGGTGPLEFGNFSFYILPARIIVTGD